MPSESPAAPIATGAALRVHQGCRLGGLNHRRAPAPSRGANLLESRGLWSNYHDERLMAPIRALSQTVVPKQHRCHAIPTSDDLGGILSAV